jgi:hypothetical protein
MRRRAAKAVFLEAFPKATIEWQSSNELHRRGYFLVRETYGAHMWIGCGDTPAAAWRYACEKRGLTGYVGEPQGEGADEQTG